MQTGTPVNARDLCIGCQWWSRSDRSIHRAYDFVVIGGRVSGLQAALALAPRVFLSALPLRIAGRDGSPCRAIAVDGLSEAELEVLAGIG
jgi:hypothetical protein